VFYRGDPHPDILFVGEAPGAAEIALQEPFVGPAGQLLMQAIGESLPENLRCGFANAILCGPYNSPSASSFRQPTQYELVSCSPRLSELIRITQPRLVIALGKIAAKALAKIEVPAKEMIHPAAILRSAPEVPYAKFCLQLKKHASTIT
jgi:DNA polymerase